MKTSAWEPTAEQAGQLIGFSHNGQHYISNTKEIRKKHAGKFIAIYEGDIKLSRKGAKELLSEIRAQFGEEKLPEVYITYVPREQEVRIA